MQNCGHNLPMAQIPPAFILPLLSPLSTTLRYSFSQCPSFNLLWGNPDLGRALSSRKKQVWPKVSVLTVIRFRPVSYTNRTLRWESPPHQHTFSPRCRH